MDRAGDERIHLAPERESHPFLDRTERYGSGALKAPCEASDREAPTLRRETGEALRITQRQDVDAPPVREKIAKGGGEDFRPDPPGVAHGDGEPLRLSYQRTSTWIWVRSRFSNSSWSRSSWRTPRI